jgi:hypothetical protein
MMHLKNGFSIVAVLVHINFDLPISPPYQGGEKGEVMY